MSFSEKYIVFYINIDQQTFQCEFDMQMRYTHFNCIVNITLWLFVICIIVALISCSLETRAICWAQLAQASLIPKTGQAKYKNKA